MEALQQKANALEKRRLELDQEVVSLKEGAAKEVATLVKGLFLEQYTSILNPQASSLLQPLTLNPEP